MIYYEDEDFKLECNSTLNEYFLHCEVKNWNISSLKKGFRVFACLLNEKEKEGVHRLVTVTPNPKFASLLGGTYFETVEKDGIRYEVYEWVLK